MTAREGSMPQCFSGIHNTLRTPLLAILLEVLILYKQLRTLGFNVQCSASLDYFYFYIDLLFYFIFPESLDSTIRCHRQH